jgi:ketosteroid isomerase-like protein
MSEKENQLAVEQYFEAMSQGDLDRMTEFFHEDAVEEWPQSGELVRGVKNMRAIYENHPNRPTANIRSVRPSKDFVVAEADLDYDGKIYNTIAIFEFDRGRIRKETAYFAEPFEAPDWRAQWVERSGMK